VRGSESGVAALGAAPRGHLDTQRRRHAWARLMRLDVDLHVANTLHIPPDASVHAAVLAVRRAGPLAFARSIFVVVTQI
jgi:hypothetical protein